VNCAIRTVSEEGEDSRIDGEVRFTSGKSETTEVAVVRLEGKAGVEDVPTTVRT
jgi:hypothetical protein